MLSWMYGGELCYWYHQLSGPLCSSDTLGATSVTGGASTQAKDFSASLLWIQCVAVHMWTPGDSNLMQELLE